jgi:manganese transport protein
MVTLLTAGATYGYTLLWVVVLSAVLGATAQYLSARLALPADCGIVGLVETHLGERWAWLLVTDVALAAGLAQLVIVRTVADVTSVVTGLDSQVAGVGWAILLAVGLAGRGYRLAEVGAKLVVSAVVVAFVASLFVVSVDRGAAAAGLVPTIPEGVSGALLAAGILGGAVHVTLVTMQTYTVRARGWTEGDLSLARLDVGASMLVAFGGYSLAIFIVTAAVLGGQTDLSPISAAAALGPVAGPWAERLFLTGLLGAAVSTLGGNTVVPPYLVAEKFGWGTNVSDSRYRTLLAATALLSGLGVFIGGALFPLLALVLAFGLIGTPFALAIVLLLLADGDAPGSLTTPTAVGGVVTLVVAVATAGQFVAGHTSTVTSDPISALVVGFAAVFGLATAVLCARAARGGAAGLAVGS